jgi:hypothetical protein
MDDVTVLKGKLAEWSGRLCGDDVHSIDRQIGHMLWRSAFYRSINESRRSLPEGVGRTKRANASLHELIDEGYHTMHSAAVRRLLDKASVSGPRGVYSLHGLIRDIRDHASVLTRANVLRARGLEYDYEPIKTRAREEAWKRTKAVGGATFVSREGWAEAEYWHDRMDRMCAVTPLTRSAADSPSPSRFDKILDDLAIHVQNVTGFVDKYIAHASSPESRRSVTPERLATSLATLWIAERTIVRAANFVSKYVVEGVNVPGVPVPQFDQFEYLDEPFAQPSALDAMRAAWAQHAQEVHTCQGWFWDSPLVDQTDIWSD